MHLIFILGPLTVITGADVTGRYGGSVTIDCTVNGPEVNNTQWMRHFNDVPAYITIDDVKYSGGSVNTSALTIHSLNDNDAAYQYQCTASNVGGVYSSANRAKITVKCESFVGFFKIYSATFFNLTQKKSFKLVY